MLKKVVFSLLMFVLCLPLAEAQNGFWSTLFPSEEAVLSNYDTTRIDPLLDQITLKFYTGYKGNDLAINNAGNSTDVFSTNTKYTLGLGFGYRWLNISSSIVAPFRSAYNKDRGKGFSFDTQINVYALRFHTDLRIQFKDGYYMKTHDEIYTNFKNQGPYEVRDDFKLKSFGGGAYYTFNKKYVHKHGFDQTKINKKSGGTLLAGLRATYFNLSADSALFENYHTLESYSLGLGLGGAYTLLMGKHWFVGVHGVVHFSGQQSLGLSNNALFDLQQNQFVISPTLRFSIGYNSPKNFFGIIGVMDNVLDNQINDSEVDYYFSSFKLMYAHRISTASFRKALNIK